jgi:hypothetical protein
MGGKVYMAVPISDGGFAVVIMSDFELPQTVCSFASEAEAEEWISHQPFQTNKNAPPRAKDNLLQEGNEGHVRASNS